MTTTSEDAILKKLDHIQKMIFEDIVPRLIKVEVCVKGLMVASSALIVSVIGALVYKFV